VRDGGLGFAASHEASGAVTNGLIVNEDLNPAREIILTLDDGFSKKDSCNELRLVILLDRSSQKGLILPRGRAS
jgi:hypothetical protein